MNAWSRIIGNFVEASFVSRKQPPQAAANEFCRYSATVHQYDFAVLAVLCCIVQYSVISDIYGAKLTYRYITDPR
jgi:hypothetical protein